MAKLPRNIDAASPDAHTEAQEQADEYESLFGTTPLELDDGTTLQIPLHPDFGMIADDRLAAYEELMFEIDTEYEREDDVYIPEQHLKNSDGEDSGVTLPATTRRGELKMPYRKLVDGKSVLVTPPHRTKVVMTALGEIEYKRLVEGGRNSGDVWKIWNEQSLKIRERQQRDSKSERGPVDLAPVPTADSE